MRCNRARSGRPGPTGPAATSAAPGRSASRRRRCCSTRATWALAHRIDERASAPAGRRAAAGVGRDPRLGVRAPDRHPLATSPTRSTRSAELRRRARAHARDARPARCGRRNPSVRDLAGDRRLRRRALRSSSTGRCASWRDASRRSRCTCTSASPIRRPRSASTTGCASICRCCSPCRPTRRSGRAATPAWPRPGRRSFRRFRGSASRAPSATTQTTSRRSTC